MILACVDVFKKRGIDFHNWVYVEAIDLSENAFRMCYIQLSLIGVSGHVIHGNTLSNERFTVWPTPMYTMTLMGPRMARLESLAKDFKNTSSPVFQQSKGITPLRKEDTVSLELPCVNGQFSLF